MSELQRFKFKNVYELVDLIDGHVKADVQFWNYNEEFFVIAASKFSKETLLHLYIVTTALNYYRREFREDENWEDEESMEKWYSLFDSYKVTIDHCNFEENQGLVKWYDNNQALFEDLFRKMADEVFYILFGNRQFLLAFNTLTATTIAETTFPAKFSTEKGTLRRVTIPKWVKTAVYHRDKGRCVFCLTDLTNLVNTLTAQNFDHIVPLDLFGSNDPCNIQLACERCNKSKTNKDGATGDLYIPWWPA